jgi:hypothetical protein
VGHRLEPHAFTLHEDRVRYTNRQDTTLQAATPEPLRTTKPLLVAPMGICASDRLDLVSVLGLFTDHQWIAMLARAPLLPGLKNRPVLHRPERLTHTKFLRGLQRPERIRQQRPGQKHQIRLPTPHDLIGLYWRGD